jgi:hypothetical protein
VERFQMGDWQAIAGLVSLGARRLDRETGWRARGRRGIVERNVGGGHETTGSGWMKDEGEARRGKQKKTMQTAGLVLGAAGLLLFIVGVKRRYKIDEEREVGPPPPRTRKRGQEPEDDEEGDRDERD